MRLLILILFINIYSASVQHVKGETWQKTVDKSQGQTVYWNAWGGDSRINSYINWAGVEVKKNYGVNVKHVKLLDTSEAVSRVLAEKAAGRSSAGSIDLIWINGENFAAMKKNKLLFGPWTSHLPNYNLVNTTGKKRQLSTLLFPLMD